MPRAIISTPYRSAVHVSASLAVDDDVDAFAVVVPLMLVPPPLLDVIGTIVDTEVDTAEVLVATLVPQLLIVGVTHGALGHSLQFI